VVAKKENDDDVGRLYRRSRAIAGQHEVERCGDVQELLNATATPGSSRKTLTGLAGTHVVRCSALIRRCNVEIPPNLKKFKLFFKITPKNM
jgi:hypothetical protein